jgi:Cu(I)-responsive transcriptional regulator
MQIGEAARNAHLPVKTVRYYEEVGLVKPLRTGNGYRDYGDRDVHLLKFVQRARSLGFSIDECRLLLSLYEDKRRASADVKALASEKIKQVDLKIHELQSMRKTLQRLAEHCHGDDKPDCPILDDLAGQAARE